MRPSSLTLKILGVFGFAALMLALARLRVTAFDPAIELGWWSALGLFLLICAGDAVGFRRPVLTVSRTLPGSFAVGVDNKVAIRLENVSPRDLQLVVSDHCPTGIEAQSLPFAVPLPAGEAADLVYRARPVKRGDAHFGDVDVRVNSPLGLWQYRHRFAQPAVVKVYPNFMAVAHFDQLGHEQQMSHLGLHVLQRRGQGMDFQQLREYRDGDVSRQIDWKASSRRHKLISRDYQDERDQEIIFLLDCGRRMRTRDDALSHFDHCLNSLLLLSYVALRQGDRVGLLSFAGEQRWLAPIKGKNNINTVLNTVYDLHSSTETSDLLEAASELMGRHRKRSLVILLSNLRDEDRDEVLAATQLLAHKHLVLVASLRENFLDQALDDPLPNLESALVYCGSTAILAARQSLLRTLRNQGVLVTDATPQSLHTQLVKEYWTLKRSGRI